MATGPDLRVGDADREAVAAELREHYAQGRLSLEEFNHRLDDAFAATTESQLHRITTDLPHTVPRSVPPLPVAASRPDADGSWGPGQRGRRPHPIGILVAIMASWLFVFSVLVPQFRFFPVPGKIAVLLAVFALARGLLRRVFGHGRYPGPRRYPRPGNYPRPRR